ncbi:MAG: DUF4097 family beta strand repeat protein [Phycisphaerales bacterium]|nr:DUF4097 domain-containing protein [Phycisphaerae bacterium]NNF42981.1 DUF4097 family beta strand repeat protein [Phycisphaerales bacterium]NNM27724.1 DUF4097 family beta strand repeat protein [Phycisphaerales bacterium]
MRSSLSIGLLLPVLAAVLLLAGGCERTLGALGRTFRAGTDAISSRHLNDEPIYFRATGPLSIDVDSFGGDVELIANSELDYAVVTVTRRATHGPGRRLEADAAMTEIEYSIDILPGPIGPILEIRAATNNVEPHFLRADVQIEVPDVDAVRIHTQRGDVTAQNVRGPVDIRTSGGDVRLLTERPMTDSVQIINDGGSIDYRVRAESSGRIDAVALRGMVRQHAPTGEILIETGTSYDRLNATLNRGTNPVVMRAADGDIRIAVVEDPTKVGLFID